MNQIFIQVYDAILYLKKKYYNNKPIMTAGMSMGGVLLRLALLYHEQERSGDAPIATHFISLDSPHRKAIIDTKFLEFMANPEKYFGRHWLANRVLDPTSRRKIRGRRQILKVTAARQMIANNPYYRDTTLTAFVDPYYYQTTYATVPNLVDTTGKLIFPEQTINIGVSFANWNSLEITGHPVRWLEAVAKWVAIWGEEFFTVSIYDDWGRPGSKFPLSFTLDENLRNYPNFPERRPTFIPITSSLAKNHEGSPSVFDVEITSDTRGSHDELPVDVMQRLLYQLGKFYPTRVTGISHSTAIKGSPVNLEAYADGGTGGGYRYEWSKMQICDEDETDPPPPGINIPTCNTWHYAGTGKTISVAEPDNGSMLLKVTVKDETIPNDETYWSSSEKLITWQEDRSDRGRGISISNYPNPFNPSTELKIDVPEIMDISITVYDLLGRKVNTVVDKQFTPGTHKITFDGSSIATGTYFYILETDQGDRIIRKMLLSK